ncbi:hypothetical protein QVD17_00897 [Tagetes erecta]|uniref:Uncharacterized protein n=1 Tax=Tagetes erecta TaxID=13708 RepID=A0AAD8P7M6_TARER|nr:hypothetical protein QVD17_00897 [Tagetes erecta]
MDRRNIVGTRKPQRPRNRSSVSVITIANHCQLHLINYYQPLQSLSLHTHSLSLYLFSPSPSPAPALPSPAAQHDLNILLIF